MTVALVLADTSDPGGAAGESAGGLGEELTALGVSRVDAVPGTTGLMTIAAAARAAKDRMLICAGAPPADELARLLRSTATAAFAGYGPAAPGRAALLVNFDDLTELAEAAARLAAELEQTPEPVGALLGELARRGVTVRVVDPAADSQVAELLTDPAAADVARWAAQRRLTPIALYGIAMSLSLLSALWFSELALRAKAFAIITLFAAFVTGRAGHMLDVTARAARVKPSPAASWLRLAGAIIGEYALYAGVAASAAIAGAGDGLSGLFGGVFRMTFVATLGGAGVMGVWRLAVAAMVFLAVRQMADRCAAIAGYRAGPSRAARLISLPAGERLTLLCATVVLVGSRAAFLALLAWGALALGYTLIRARNREGPITPEAATEITACRDDGPVAVWLGGFVQDRIPPLVPLAAGLLVTGMLVVLGLGNLPGVLIVVPVVALLLAALGSRHPHDQPRDWLVPPALQAGEFMYLAALAFARGVSEPVTFALLMAVVLRHFEVACRARVWPGKRADKSGLGWDGRLLVAGAFAIFGIVPAGYVLLSVYLWLLLVRDFLVGWLPDRLGYPGFSGPVASPDDGSR
jgi:hypothetical protein